MTGIELHPAVLAALEAHGIAFEPMACDPDLADTAAFCQAYGIPVEDSANTILVASRANPPDYAACLVLAHTRLDVNRAVRQRLGARKASFASAGDTVGLTGMLIGGVTIFGLPLDMPIWVDSRVLGRDRVIVGGGNRSSKVIIPPAELNKIPGLEFVEGLAIEPPAQ